MFGNAFKQIVLLDVKVRIVHNVSTGVSLLQDASQHTRGLPQCEATLMLWKTTNYISLTCPKMCSRSYSCSDWLQRRPVATSPRRVEKAVLGNGAASEFRKHVGCAGS